MPYITKLAPGQESLEALRSLYIKTERKIINEITRKRNLNYVDYAEVAALERVQAILRDMTDKTDEYIPQVIEKYFYDESTMPGASKGYANAMALTTTQTNISQILINNLLAQIDEAAGVAYNSASKFLEIGRLEADAFRNLTLEAAAEREASGRGWQTIQNQLAAELNAKGLTSFTDAAGREWSLSNYCTMATRTTGRQAQVAAALTADDHDLWQISKIGSTCPLCSVYEGRVYSKSGTNPDYPPLAMAFGKIDPAGSNDLSNTYLNIHPNCLHSLVKYTTIGKTDEQIEKDKKFSSFEERPDTVDYRSKRQVKAYREKEAARAKYRQDLKQFEKYKAALGKDMPKNFETFEKHKKLDDDLYKSWEQGFRNVNATAKAFEQAEAMQLYQKEYSKELYPFLRGNKPIITQKITDYADNVYVSVNAKIKPRALHELHNRIMDAKKIVGADGFNSDIVIVGEKEFRTSTTVGSYAPLTDTYYISFASKDIEDTVHEMYHWKDAFEYRKNHSLKTVTDYNRYIDQLRRRHKKLLDKAGVTRDNVGTITRYAKNEYLKGHYDETYTEYRTYRR